MVHSLRYIQKGVKIGRYEKEHTRIASTAARPTREYCTGTGNEDTPYDVYTPYTP